MTGSRRAILSGLASMIATGFLACDSGTHEAKNESLRTELFAPPANAITEASDRGNFMVHLWPRDGAIPVRRLHEWGLRVTGRDGGPVRATYLNIDGGMPQHGHGLITQPEITAEDADGNHIIEGMKFHMGGEWTLRIEVVAGDLSDFATFRIQVGP